MSFWSKTTSLRWFFEVKWSSQQHYTYMYKAFLLWHASPGMDMDKVVAWRISLNPIPKWNCFFTITNWLGNELDLFVHFILFISASLPPCEANGANMGYKCSYLALKSRYLVSFFLFSRHLNSSNSFVRYLFQSNSPIGANPSRQTSKSK